MFKNNKGFTIVELVVVIAVIGILASIAIPYYTDAQATARGAKIVADMRTIQSAYTMYLAKNGGVQKNIIVGDTAEYPDIIPTLVEQGYLESVPVPPEGKALFPHAIDTLKELNIYKTSFGGKQLGGYTFIKHSAVDGEELIVGLDLATSIPLTDLVGH